MKLAVLLLASLPGLSELKDLRVGPRRGLSYSIRTGDIRLNALVMLVFKFGRDSGAKAVGCCAGDGAVRAKVCRCDWMARKKAWKPT